jgi:hypothetical protein
MIVDNQSLANAISELSNKTIGDIQVETAITWTNRACAAMHLNKTDDAKEYAHEAIEHAALTGSLQVIDQIYMTLAEYGIPIG